MGRKKQGYEASEGLSLQEGVWWIRWQHGPIKIKKSTKTKNLIDAEKIFNEVKRRVFEREAQNTVGEILEDAPTFKQLMDQYQKEVADKIARYG